VRRDREHRVPAQTRCPVSAPAALLHRTWTAASGHGRGRDFSVTSSIALAGLRQPGRLSSRLSMPLRSIADELLLIYWRHSPHDNAGPEQSWSPRTFHQISGRGHAATGAATVFECPSVALLQKIGSKKHPVFPKVDHEALNPTRGPDSDMTLVD